MKHAAINFWMRLDRRLIALICLAVLPINLIAIWFSSVAVRESQEKVILAQSREFEILTSQESAKLQSLEQWCSDYVQTNLERMILPRNFSAVFSIHATNQMAMALEEMDLPGFVFVQEHEEEEKLYVRPSKNLLTLRQVTDIKTELQPFIQEQLTVSYSNTIKQLCEKPYYMAYYAMNNYTLGFAVDLQHMLHRWNTSLLTDCRLAVLYGEEILLTDGDGVLVEMKAVSPDSLAKGTAGDMTFLLYPGHSNKAVPGAYVVLQLLAWGSLTLLVLLWTLIRRQVIRPLRVLQKGMEQLEKEVDYRIDQEASTADFKYLYDAFNRMAEDIQKSHEKDILIYQTQLNNLKLQVNPHMLLNSLSMIYSLAQTKQYELIQKFTLQLVEYFRYCLRENNDLVPLRSELQFVANYMELQKTRFPGELAYTYYVDEKLEEALIPPLLIQNFVENATKYARSSQHPTEVLIWIRKNADRLNITVEDTGNGIPQEILSSLNGDQMYVDETGLQHIGVWNCRRRLEIFYKGDASLVLESKLGKGTSVHIDIPFLLREGESYDDIFNCG